MSHMHTHTHIHTNFTKHMHTPINTNAGGYVPLMAASTDLLVDRLHWLSSQNALEAEKTGEAPKSVELFRELGALTLQVNG